jgi:hypothetical protein
VQDLVGDQNLATIICSSYDVAGKGAQAAVLQYLAQSSSSANALETNNSLNTLFLLFSGYLVFIMQAGFAMVRRSAAEAA